MAKKTTTVTQTIPDSEIPGPIAGDLSFTSVESDVVLDKIKAQFPGSRITIKVFKIVVGHKPIFQFEQDVHVTETQLQLYGGGLYHVRYFVDGTLTYTDEIEVADKAVDTSKPKDASDIQIQMLREQSQFNRELLMAVLSSSGKVATSTPMTEIAQMWALIHGVNPSNGGGGFDKLIDVFTKGLELGANKGGDMDWKTTLISAARELAPGIVQAVAVSKGVVPVNGNQLPPDQTAITPEQLLKHGLGLLKPKIVAGLPVGLALDWVVANSSDPQYQPFIALAIQKEFQDLVNADNEVANEPYNTWLRSFLKELKEHFKQAVEESNEPED